jgi:hypothetical protein
MPGVRRYRYAEKVTRVMKYYLCTIIVALIVTSHTFAGSRPDTPAPRKIDSYEATKLREERMHLDGLVSELKKEPHSQGYILVYAGKRAYRGEAVAHGRKAKEYLVKRKGIDARQIVVVDAGYREKLTVELFVVPSGGAWPQAEPTVDPIEVQIIGGKKGKRHY